MTVNEIQLNYSKDILTNFLERIVETVTLVIKRKNKSNSWFIAETLSKGASSILEYYTEEELVNYCTEYINTKISDFSKYYKISITKENGTFHKLIKIEKNDYN